MKLCLEITRQSSGGTELLSDMLLWCSALLSLPDPGIVCMRYLPEDDEVPLPSAGVVPGLPGGVDVQQGRAGGQWVPGPGCCDIS